MRPTQGTQGQLNDEGPGTTPRPTSLLFTSTTNTLDDEGGHGDCTPDP